MLPVQDKEVSWFFPSQANRIQKLGTKSLFWPVDVAMKFDIRMCYEKEYVSI